MFSVFKERIAQKYRTNRYPAETPAMPERFRGLPKLRPELCSDDCSACAAVCPTRAVSSDKLSLDLGRCIFCGACAEACPTAAITFTDEHRLATSSRDDLLLHDAAAFKHAEAMGRELLRIFKRSFRLRQVSAGGCGACEADVNVLGTVGYDLGRFGISFVASPRHADGLLITGPVSRNMEEALRKTYAAVPAPKIVIAAGACAVSGGLFQDAGDTCNGAADVVPVDAYIPGCPPHPLTILDALLTLCDRR